MAFIANTAFEARITNNEFNALCNITGMYQESEANADCSAGILCTRVSLMPCEGFPGVYNENAWLMNAATADANIDTDLYACNTYEAKMVEGYYIGTETLGLGIPAGRYGTFTHILFDGQHQYRFGVGNLTGALGDNKFLTVGANGMLVPAASAPTDAGSVYFEVTETGNFTEGTSESFGYVQGIAKKVTA